MYFGQNEKVDSLVPVDKVEGKIYSYEDAERLRREEWVRKQVYLNSRYSVVRNPSDPRLYAPNKKVKNPQDLTTVEIAKTLCGLHIIEGGLGLAAPQIGCNLQMFAMTIGANRFAVLMNARIVGVQEDGSDENIAYDSEGCISHPGVWAEVARIRKIEVIAQTMAHPKPQKFEFEGLLARVIQHEIDHTLARGGRLFTDLPANCLRNLRVDTPGQERLLEENRKAAEFGFIAPEAE